MRKLLLCMTITCFALAMVAPAALACYNDPPLPPPAWIEERPDSVVCIVLHGYQTFGTQQTPVFCACAFAQLVSCGPIDSVRSNIPQFNWTANTATGDSASALLGGNWQGFLAEVTDPITTGLDVDLRFYCKLRAAVPAPVGGGGPEASHPLQALKAELEGLGLMVATGEGQPAGGFTGGHFAAHPAGQVEIMVLVPTLTQWGIIVVVLMLLIGGTYEMRRRRRAEAR